MSGATKLKVILNYKSACLNKRIKQDMDLLTDLDQLLTRQFPGVKFIKKVPGLMLVIGKTQSGEQLYKYYTKVDEYGNQKLVSLEFYTNNTAFIEKYKQKED